MKKFSINDEVYQAGRFGLKVPLIVRKINHAKDGSITYTCSASEGKDEKDYNTKEINLLVELY